MKPLGASALVGLLVGLGVVWWLDEPGAGLNAGAVALVLLVTVSAATAIGQWIRGRGRSLPDE